MKPMPLDTVAHIIVYIQRHENAFGFKPTAVGVHPEHWQGIVNEFKSCQRFTENNTPEISEFNGVYVLGCRLITNMFMEKVE